MQQNLTKTPLTRWLNHSKIKVSDMKGIIFINPFLVPTESVRQAERLKEEFNRLGVEIDIISNGFSRVFINGESTKVNLADFDFAIYLDKDKYLSEVLEKSGVRLFNSHKAVRVCDDKAQTYIALLGKGVDFPKTIFGALCYKADLEINPEWADKIAGELGYPVIVKESYGSMGKGVYKADDRVQLISIMEKVKLKAHLFQEYINVKKGVDVRVIVVGGVAVGAMERTNEKDFRSNVGAGGTGKKIELSPEFKMVAERVACVLELDYCGVDLLYGKGLTPVVCEVNSNAFFEEFEKVTGVNVALAYAKHVVDTIKNSVYKK